MELEQFIQLISDIANIPSENIYQNSNFRDDLGIDSLNMVNLFLELSEKTGVGFERFVGTDDIKTVNSVYQVITKGVK